MTATPYQTTDRVPAPGVYALPFTIEAASISAATIMNAFVPGHPFKIVGIKALTNVAITTGSKAATVTAYIDGVTTGAAVTVSGTKALGTFTDGSAPTADLTGTATSTLSFVASDVTAFTEGRLTFYVMVRNLDNC